MKRFMKLFIIIILFSCNNLDEFIELKSHNGQKQLFFCYITSMNPNKKPVIKIKAELRSDEYATIKYSKDFGIHINWNTQPIKIRGAFLIENKGLNLDIKTDCSLEEDEQLKDSLIWVYYDLSLIHKGAK